MTFVEVLSIIVACLGLLVGVIALVRMRSAEGAADEATARAVEALARADTAAKAAAAANEAAATANRNATAAGSRAGQADQTAATAADLAERAQAQATQALARAAAAAEEAAVAARRGREGAASPVSTNEVVRWECEQVRGSTWIARNVGTIVAHSALLSDASRPPKYIRPDEVIPRDVPPGDHLQFRALSDGNVRSPRLRVIWSEAGHDTPQAQEVTLVLP